MEIYLTEEWVYEETTCWHTESLPENWDSMTGIEKSKWLSDNAGFCCLVESEPTRVVPYSETEPAVEIHKEES